MADPNTRQGKRTPVTLKIKFKSETLEQFIERYAVDVSQGGIFIRTKEPLAVGTQMRFEFQLRDASPLIAGDGTVVWTRENDPSRPAIAPGMGVRFDRLADGSQTVLERILSEKAKQAPQRVHGEPTKPPLFTDTPTRVAPAPVQDALLGNDSKKHRSDEHTPLPKPMPFHSDADEFPDEAFEEATKVRALDDLIAQTAGEGDSAQSGELFSGKPPDELAARRGSANRMDATVTDPPTKEQIAATAQHLDNAGTAPGFASGRSVPERESAPGLPSPPETSAPTKAPRLLDTTPSPRTEESADAKAALIAQNARMEKLAKTRIGMEPAPATTRSASTSTPPASVPVVQQPPPASDRASGSHAVEAAPPRTSAPQPAATPSGGSKAPLVILLLVLLAAGGAGVWFFFLREKAVEKNGNNIVKNDLPKNGSDGSAKQPDGSGSAGAGAGTGSAVVEEPPKGPLVDIEIASTTPKAEIEVVGTTFKGPAPLKAKLEKDKAYKVRISAPGFATLEQDVKGGQDKVTAKLDPKPHVITVTSEPAGALIFIDGIPAGHVTPYDVELTKVQSARRAVRVGLRKGGFKPIEKLVEIGSFKEDAAKMMASVDEKLVVQQVVIRPPVVGSGSGSATQPVGSGSGDGGGSSTTPPPTGGSGTTPPPTGSATPPPNTGGGSGGTGGTSGGGSAKEPEPEFVKPNP